MNRNGELAIVDVPEPGRERERERYPIVYGAKLKKHDGQKVKPSDLLAEWDPYTLPMLTQVGGTVKFGDLLEGVTVEERVDERTGLSTKVIIDTKDIEKRPRITIKDAEGHHPQAPERDRGALPAAGRHPPERLRRTGGRSGRHHRQDAARDHQDEGHHRRSAARRRALRGAQAEGVRGRQRDRRRGVVRQGHQGQAQGRSSRPRSARRAST